MHSKKHLSFSAIRNMIADNLATIKDTRAANKSIFLDNSDTKMFYYTGIGHIWNRSEVSLVGFGNFSVSKVESRPGRNPRTGETIQIKAYNQPKFKVGQSLKDSVNNK
ncbi:HU family DNA-binding protein [Rickettsiaceae bacterium]|jgi:nucleoid DNA-binding protein|nr:HU family DNA-binding protein [Rickettsiaceae bacterium]